MTQQYILGGGFTIARKLFQSAIWLRDPLDLKTWIWIMGKANHSGIDKNGRRYERGEFVTTYDEIIKAGMFIRNRKRIFPSIKKVRIILLWLQNEGMILVKPLKSERCRTGADTGAETRAYVGLRIVVVNYNAYQDLESYRGRHYARNVVEQGHNSNNEYNNDKNISDEILSLRKKYSDQELIDQAFQAIASTRKSNRVADSVIHKQLKKWDGYPVTQVEGGIRTYLKKDCAGEGKREEYLLGIIRNNPVSQPNSSNSSTPEWF